MYKLGANTKIRKLKFKQTKQKQRKNQYIWDHILTVKMSQNNFTLQTV